jgi:hypothetical protein
MATRRVEKVGAIWYENQRIFISQALAGWDLGLGYRTQEVMEVSFAQLLIGSAGNTDRSLYSHNPKVSHDQEYAS